MTSRSASQCVHPAPGPMLSWTLPSAETERPRGTEVESPAPGLGDSQWQSWEAHQSPPGLLVSLHPGKGWLLLEEHQGPRVAKCCWTPERFQQKWEPWALGREVWQEGRYPPPSATQEKGIPRKAADLLPLIGSSQKRETARMSNKSPAQGLIQGHYTVSGNTGVWKENVRKAVDTLRGQSS